MQEAPLTIARARQQARDAFQKAGIPTADLDARLLLAWAADISSEALYSTPELELTPVAKDRLAEAIKQRALGKSVARIIGRRSFWTFDLELSDATLEPRPDTEIIVERVLAHIDQKGLLSAPLKIIDMGVGTGAILLALLSELPNASGIGIDLSLDALKIARTNSERLGLVNRCLFCCGNHLDGIRTSKVDIVVSNPPYIDTDSVNELDWGVRRYDPALALDGGPTGLRSYQQMFETLRAQGLPKLGVWFEIGFDQEMAVSRLFSGLSSRISCYRDLAELPRCIELINQDETF